MWKVKREERSISGEQNQEMSDQVDGCKMITNATSSSKMMDCVFCAVTRWIMVHIVAVTITIIIKKSVAYGDKIKTAHVYLIP